MIGCSGGEIFPAIDRTVLLTPHLRLRYQMGKGSIPVRRPGEQHQVISFWQVGWLGPVGADASPPPQSSLASPGPRMSVLVPGFCLRHRVHNTWSAGFEAYLHSIYDGKTCCPGCLPEPGDPIEPVVVGHRKSFVAQRDSTIHEVLRVGCPIEE